MRVARSSKKIPYGVSRAEIRALTSVQGPLNHTPIIPQVEAFVNRQNKQKIEVILHDLNFAIPMKESTHGEDFSAFVASDGSGTDNMVTIIFQIIELANFKFCSAERTLIHFLYLLSNHR